MDNLPNILIHEKCYKAKPLSYLAMTTIMQCSITFPKNAYEYYSTVQSPK